MASVSMLAVINAALTLPTYVASRHVFDPHLVERPSYGELCLAGDDAGVDLNNIPAAAIERVEVLLDGASSLYGTDAIGGVINFITRKDYQGFEASTYVGRTQEGGAEKRTFTLGGGIGDLQKMVTTCSPCLINSTPVVCSHHKENSSLNSKSHSDLAISYRVIPILPTFV